MKYSIIIPTYNSAKVLGRVLDSIVCQTFGDFEILIMDGASSDNTLGIANSYNDRRIKIFSEPDKGIYDAMNKGIEKSQGEWLYFIGSDDYLLNPDVLKNVSSQLTDDYDVVYGEVESDLTEKNRGEWTLETLEYNRCHQAIFYKRSLFGKIGFYTLKYRILADHDLNLKWFLCSEIKKKHIDISIAHFTSGGCSCGNADDGFYNDFYTNMLKKYFRILPIAVKIKYIEKALLHANSFTERLFLRILLYSVRIYKKIFCR